MAVNLEPLFEQALIDPLCPGRPRLNERHPLWPFGPTTRMLAGGSGLGSHMVTTVVIRAQ
jgi:hypothetical protein